MQILAVYDVVWGGLDTCRIPVGWFSDSDVRTKSFFSPPSYGLILVLLYLVPSYLVVWCGD